MKRLLVLATATALAIGACSTATEEEPTDAPDPREWTCGDVIDASEDERLEWVRWAVLTTGGDTEYIEENPADALELANGLATACENLPSGSNLLELLQAATASVLDDIADAIDGE